jgi:hypothetical protein
LLRTVAKSRIDHNWQKITVQRMARNDATKAQRQALWKLSTLYGTQMRAMQESKGYRIYDASRDTSDDDGTGWLIGVRTFEALIRHGWVEEAEPVQGAKRWRISAAGHAAARVNENVRHWLC